MKQTFVITSGKPKHHADAAGPVIAGLVGSAGLTGGLAGPIVGMALGGAMTGAIGCFAGSLGVKAITSVTGKISNTGFQRVASTAIGAGFDTAGDMTADIVAGREITASSALTSLGMNLLSHGAGSSNIVGSVKTENQHKTVNNIVKNLEDTTGGDPE